MEEEMGQQWEMPGTEPTAHPRASQDRAPPSPAVQWQLLGCRGAGSESSSKAGRNTGGETPRRGGPKEAPGSSSASSWTLSSVHVCVGTVMSAEKLLIFREN